jgi:hypothetical protein
MATSDTRLLLGELTEGVSRGARADLRLFCLLLLEIFSRTLLAD